MQRKQSNTVFKPFVVHKIPQHKNQQQTRDSFVDCLKMFKSL